MKKVPGGPMRWLIGLNFILLCLLVLSYFHLPKVYAQVRPHDYVLVPGRISEHEETVWIIDLGSKQLTSCTYRRGGKRIEVGEVLDLGAQFRTY